MRKYTQLIVIAAFFSLFACRQETAPRQNAESVLSLATPEQFDNLTIYPIVAGSELLAQHAHLAGVKTLADVMGTPGFRITEPKQFGREDGAWYNRLTLVNKTADTVYMMSGDVVTGGNQDRVNGENLIALPGTIRNIPVFCVEQGRSTYYNPDASVEERKLAAFNGYYSVASPRVRKAVMAGDQEDVWGAVAAITDAHQASSDTRTYDTLDRDNTAKQQRDACIRFFKEKWTGRSDLVGMIAVCNQKVIGGELFGHPRLFQRKMEALLHSYAVESGMVPPSVPVLNPSLAESVLQQLQQAAEGQKVDQVARFDWSGSWVHIHTR